MEQVTGRSWEDLMRAELFEPLSMTSCGFGPPGGEQPGGVPMGHDPDDQPTDQDAPALLGPAGTVHCSLPDWAKFVQELLLASDGEGELLAAETAQTLLSTHPVPVGEDEGFEAGLGWTIQQGPNGPVYSYDGSNTYWFSQALMVPESWPRPARHEQPGGLRHGGARGRSGRSRRDVPGMTRRAPQPTAGETGADLHPDQMRSEQWQRAGGTR